MKSKPHENLRLIGQVLRGSCTDYVYTVTIRDGQPIATFHGSGCARVTGYTSEEYQADPYLWYRMVYWEDRDAVSAQVTQVLAGETVSPLEHRIVHKDGSIRWVRSTSVPRYDDQGLLVAYDGLISDITELKQTEEKLRMTLAKTEALYHVARSLVTFESLADLLQIVTNSVAEALPADRVIMILFDLEQRQITQSAVGGPGAANITLASFDEFMDGLSGWVLRELKPALSPKGNPDPRESPSVQKRRAETNGGAIIAVPLRYRDQVQGTMTVINRADQPDFTLQDVELVMAMVNQVAVAIENARLFEETGRLKTFNENIVQNAAEAILIEDAEGLCTFANPAAEELLGYSHAELAGLHWSAIVHTDQTERVRQETAKRAQGQVSRYETVVASKAGRAVPVIISGRPLYEDGKFFGVLAALTDITQQKQTEEALARERDLLHALMDNIPDTIYFKDTAGHFIRVNAAQAQLLGLNDPELAVGKTDFDFFTPEHAQDAYADEQAIIRTGQPLIGKIEKIRRADGEFRWVSCTKAPIQDKANQPMGIVGVSRDVTEWIQARESLRQYAAELAARNEELDAFAHTVAHDLKHTLSIIIGLSETLESDYTAMPVGELDEYLSKIAKNGRKMSNIVEELLLLSSVRQMDELDITPLDMAEIVAEVRERLADLITGYQTKIILPKQWPVALGYAPWIEEVWVNYISNAVKYGGRPPRVEVGATPLPNPPPQAGEGKGGGMVRFWVHDNGPGLTPQEQAQLFEPFTRLDQIRARGYGLGLSIVRRIVEKLGGQVGVESQPGQGSIFSFTLPAASYTPHPLPPPLCRGGPGRGPKSEIQ